MLGAASFAGLFLLVFVLSGLIVSALGVDMITAYSGAAATLSNSGPGLGMVGPATNFAGLPESAKWVYSLTMLVGRLDVLALIVVLTPDFWRK
jgi:trk system potassium uptake protein TrkH